MNDVRNTCAYIRLSEEDRKVNEEKYSESILNQIKLIEDYSVKNNMGIPQNYIDDGYSGINFDRPAIEQLRKDIENRKVKTVITKDFSRLGRDYIETAYFITEYFPKYNVRYISINDNYDSDNKDSQFNDLMIAVKSIMNDRVVRDASVKVTQIKKMKTRQGNFMGFIAPYGYKRTRINDINTLEIDENVSNIVIRIFEDIANGKSRAEIAEELNEEKIKTPMEYLKMTESSNKKYYYEWTDKIIYRIIKNDTYTGNTIERKSYKKNYRQKKREYIPIKERKVIKNTHPAIISEELFEKANKMLKTCKARNLPEYTGLFRNLVICGECGKIMTPNKRIRESGNITYHFSCNKRENRTMCKNRNISDSKLNNIVTSVLKEIIDKFADEEIIINEVSNNKIKNSQYERKINNLKMDIEVHNNNVRKLYLKKTTNEITLEEFMKQKKIEDKMKKLKEEELKRLCRERDLQYQKEDILKKYQQFIQEDNLLKNTLKDLVEHIIVFKNNVIQIKFKFSCIEDVKIKLY